MSALNSLALCFVFSAVQLTSSTDPGNKDGFNFYKDYLRGKSDEIPIIPGPDGGDRVLYFYRTPAQLHAAAAASPIAESILEREFGKRNANKFKNHMLNKELWVDGEPGVQKRTSKSALSWIMSNKHNLFVDGGKQLEDMGMEVF